MSRIVTLFLLVGALAGRGAGAEGGGKTGSFTLTFTDRSPLSSPAEICSRMR